VASSKTRKGRGVGLSTVEKWGRRGLGGKEGLVERRNPGKWLAPGKREKSSKYGDCEKAGPEPTG